MTDDDRKQPVVLSRDELYSQIWTTPMIRLAAQYGITGTRPRQDLRSPQRALAAARLSAMLESRPAQTAGHGRS
jgi:hypothetical protein